MVVEPWDKIRFADRPLSQHQTYFRKTFDSQKLLVPYRYHTVRKRFQHTPCQLRLA